MAQVNFKRMMELIDETFATRQDPEQLQVTPAQLKKLKAIHPATLTELANEQGPLIWVLVIPTSIQVRDAFIKGEISETRLLELTGPGQAYEALYLCSVTALPEARGKGQALDLCLKAIQAIMQQHSIKSLYTWPFSPQGLKLAGSLANSLNLPLLLRQKN